MADLKSYIDTKFGRISPIKGLAMSPELVMPTTINQYSWTLPSGCLNVGIGRFECFYKQIYKIRLDNSIEAIKSINEAPGYNMLNSIFEILQDSNLKSYIDAKARNLKPLIIDVALGAPIRVVSNSSGSNARNKYFITKYEWNTSNSTATAEIRPLMYKLFGENAWRM